MCTINGDFSDDRKSENFDTKEKLRVFFFKMITQSKVLQCAIFLPFFIQRKYFITFKYFGSLSKHMSKHVKTCQNMSKRKLCQRFYQWLDLRCSDDQFVQ